MFTIGKIYHVVHVVSNLDAADKWYDSIFSPNRYYHGYMDEAKRDASLLAIGDFVMEPVAVAKVPGAEDSALGRFFARFGPRLHSVAWFVDSVPNAFDKFRQHNVRMYGADGIPLKAPKPGRAFFTHPKDTYGTLEFAPHGGLRPDSDPRLKPGWSTAFWRDQHPLGMQRASHMTTLVRDLDKATAFYRDVVGGTLLHEEAIAGRKSSVYFALGNETVMELAQPLSSSSAEGRELERCGEGLYSVTIKVNDIRKAESFLRSKRMRIEAQDGGSFVLNREDSLGAVLGFTERQLPNDHRQ